MKVIWKLLDHWTISSEINAECRLIDRELGLEDGDERSEDGDQPFFGASGSFACSVRHLRPSAVTSQGCPSGE
jgi:hypothetical protein